MKRIVYTIMGLLVVASSAQATSCIPPFLQENHSYFLQNGETELDVKIIKIDADSCWVKVKEDLDLSKKHMNYPEKKKNAFWVNFDQILAIRKKN